MTRDEVALTALEQTQDRLVTELPRALTGPHREFLLSLSRAEPAWELMPYKHCRNCLAAVDAAESHKLKSRHRSTLRGAI